MAKLRKGIHFTGTVGDLCFYQVGKRTYLRAKSSLTRKRVLKSKEFENTRKYAGNFALASQIASVIYRALPADIKARWIYRSIAGEAASLLYKGKEEQEVRDLLWKKYIDADTVTKEPGKVKSPIATEQVKPELENIFLKRWKKQGKRAADFKEAWRDPRSYNTDSPRNFSMNSPLFRDLFLRQ